MSWQAKAPAPRVNLAPDGIQASVEAVLRHPLIRAFGSAQILKIEGQPGMFDVTLEVEYEQQTVRAGAIVVATGWKPYDASRLTHLGYGVSPNVVTSVEFEQMAVNGAIVRAALRWEARQACAVHPVRRFPRQGSPGVLFVVVLYDDAGAIHLRPRSGSASGSVRSL
jgi:hypothetical protein